jgi:transposase InsO family protein
VVALHLDGWSAKAIASYMGISKRTVYRVLVRWLEEGEVGLQDRPPGGPKGVRKVDLATMDFIRRSQENPELGAFRVHAALVQKRGAEVSVRTVGRVMAVHRELYGIAKPKRSPHQKKAMPFEASRRHQIWTADVRYVKKHRLPVEGYLYVISILENYSRKILASAVCRKQDLASFLPVLHSAVGRYGSPETFVTDSGSVFLANRAREVYEALGMDKVEIEKGRPWQSFIETTFNIQKKVADHHFAKAGNWQELVDAHDRWMGDYNAQRHWAHDRREDGRCSPEAVLGFYTGVRYHPEDLRRAFFESRHDRVLNALGYARLMHWRIFGHERLAKRDVALWLSGDTLSVAHAGETLSRCEVEYRPGRGGLGRVRCLELFEDARGLPQPRLFGLEEALGVGPSYSRSCSRTRRPSRAPGPPDGASGPLADAPGDRRVLFVQFLLVHGREPAVLDDPLTRNHDAPDHMRAALHEQVVQAVGEGSRRDDRQEGGVGAVHENQVRGVPLGDLPDEFA